MKYLDTSNDQLKKKSLIKKISTRLLGLEFKSDNIMKSKTMILLLKKCCQILRTMETYYLSCKKKLRTKIQVSEKLNKID